MSLVSLGVGAGVLGDTPPPFGSSAGMSKDCMRWNIPINVDIVPSACVNSLGGLGTGVFSTELVAETLEALCVSRDRRGLLFLLLVFRFVLKQLPNSCRSF